MMTVPPAVPLGHATGVSLDAHQCPADFVDVEAWIPEIEVDLRYFSDANFVGRPIAGYEAPVCLLTRRAAEALSDVTRKLASVGLNLRIYDGYRPQRAVDDFAAWATRLEDVAMKDAFYPEVEKTHLFRDGYIASRSSHSRGSAVDVSIVSSARHARAPLENSRHRQRSPANAIELDFGSSFDFFGPASRFDHAHISPQAKSNRLLLRTLMVAAGFQPYEEEWWHFNLIDEPYPHTYFDFPINAGLVSQLAGRRPA